MRVVVKEGNSEGYGHTEALPLPLVGFPFSVIQKNLNWNNCTPPPGNQKDLRKWAIGSGLCSTHSCR